MILEAEAKQGEAWTPVSPAEATSLSGVPLRCPACHGAVAPWTGVGGKPHFGHLVAHTGCKLAYNFAGTQTRHPDALL